MFHPGKQGPPDAKRDGKLEGGNSRNTDEMRADSVFTALCLMFKGDMVWNAEAPLDPEEPVSCSPRGFLLMPVLVWCSLLAHRLNGDPSECTNEREHRAIYITRDTVSLAGEE